MSENRFSESWHSRLSPEQLSRLEELSTMLGKKPSEVFRMMIDVTYFAVKNMPQRSQGLMRELSKHGSLAWIPNLAVENKMFVDVIKDLVANGADFDMVKKKLSEWGTK